VDGYLLDTCAVTALLDAQHPNHAVVRVAVETIEQGAPRYVSCVTLAEIRFGALLDEASTGKTSPRTAQILKDLHGYPVLEITRHTAGEYGELRTNIAVAYLATYLRANRPRWIENWKDRATGERLQIDENDVWICAQARERNLVLITTDKKMTDVIAKADPTVRLKLVTVG
jgi:tRNA(fMet)-specific endonuclease VapC